MEEGLKPHIIFTVTNDLSFDQRMDRICSTLVGEGFEVTLVGRKRRQSAPLNSRSYYTKRLNCRFEKGKLFYIEYNIRLFLFLLFSKSEIISSVDLDTLFACTLAARIRSKKLVFDAHEYFTEVPEVTNRPLTKKIWSMVAYLCIRHTHKAYTVSHSLATIFEETYKKTFAVIRNVPLLRQPREKSTTTPYIIYQGDLNEGRGLEEIIDAMKEINIPLVIAGNGPLYDKLNKQVQGNKLEHKVQFKGYLDAEELHQLTAEAWLGINLLKQQGLSYYYSLSNKFFNYIHAGTPQLCADFPEYQTINSQYPVALLCPCNTGSIVEAIKQLKQDKDKYEKMRKACDIAAQTFNWQLESKTLIQLYQELSLFR